MKMMNMNIAMLSVRTSDNNSNIHSMSIVQYKLLEEIALELKSAERQFQATLVDSDEKGWTNGSVTPPIL